MSKPPRTKITGFAGHLEPDTKAVTNRAIYGNDAPIHGIKSGKNVLQQYSDTVFSVTKRIADKTSSTECRLYSTARTATTKNANAVKAWDRRHKRLQNSSSKYLVTGGEDVAEITSNPACDLLRRPNSKMSGRQLLAYTQLYLDVAGICIWHLRADGVGAIDVQPDEILVLPPHLVHKQPGTNLYRYGNETLQAAELLIITAENLANPYGDDPGTSGVRAILPTLQLQDRITDTLTAIMENEGRPSVIIAPKGDNMWGEDEAIRMERSFTRFTGLGSGKAWFPDGDISVTPLNYKPTDLAALELARYVEELVCQTFQMPVMIHRGTEGGSRAAYETAMLEWCDGGISSRLRDLEDFLNFKYLPRFGESESLFFCFDDPSPSNAAEEEKRVLALWQGELITLNQARAMLGHEPVDDGDQTITKYKGNPLAALSPVAATAPAAEQTAAPVAPAPTQQEIETNPALTLNGAQISSALAIVSQVATGQLPRESGLGALQILLNLSADQAATIMGPVGASFFAPVANDGPPAAPQKRLIIPDDHKPSTKAHKPIKPETESPELEKVLVKHFRRWAGVAEQAVKHMGDHITTKALPKKFVPIAAWTKDLAEDSQPVIEMIYREGAKKMKDRIVQRVGASADVFDVSNAHVAKRARSAALDLAQSTLDTTTKAVNDALDQTRESLAEGIEEGEGMRKLTNRVKEIFESAEQHRAERIARTESVRASTEGLRDQAVESGVVKSFEWISTSDPCPLCADMNGKEIPLNGDLPPLHPNCQCQLLENISDD